MNVTVPPDYKPGKNEEFMNPKMVEYFRQKLTVWRTDLVQESNSTLQQLQEGGIVEADIADRASVETERSLELRTRDRARKLINKIDDALGRIHGPAGLPIGAVTPSEIALAILAQLTAVRRGRSTVLEMTKSK